MIGERTLRQRVLPLSATETEWDDLQPASTGANPAVAEPSATAGFGPTWFGRLKSARGTSGRQALVGLLVLIVVAVVGGALLVGSGAQPAVHHRSEGAGWVRYVSKTGRYSLSYPAEWKASVGLAGELELHIARGDAVDIQTFKLAKPVDALNISGLTAVTGAILSTPQADLTVIAKQAVQVSGIPGMYFLYYFPAGRGQGVHAHYFLFQGTTLYSLVFQALPATDFDSLAPEFDAVAKSFSVSNR